MITVHSSPPPPLAIGFAPGKIILSGEHSVVYGHPSIVLATKVGSMATILADGAVQNQSNPEIPVEFGERVKRIFAEHLHEPTDNVNLQLNTDLPIQSGMGSSASVAAAAFRALATAVGKELTATELFELIQESERAVHGNPSGIDAAAVTYQGVLKFQKHNGQATYERISLPKTLETFFLISSGKPVETTGEMVAYVAQQYRDSAGYREVVDQLGDTTTQVLSALQSADLSKLLPLIDQNHQLLENLGIVSPQAQQLARQLQERGAVVKLTGAGGRQAGSGMLLVFHSDQEKLRHFCQHNRLQCIETAVEYGREQ